MEITKERVIELNRKYGGSPLLISNLDFDLDQANHEKSIWKSNAYIVRAMVAGHSFNDGNKSTAIKIITDRFAKERIGCDKNKLVNGLIKLATNKTSDINKIERNLRKWCWKL